MTEVQHGRQIHHEGSMLEGGFVMVKFFEPEAGGLLITVKDQKTSHTAEANFDVTDLSSLADQLKEEANSKNFCKALLKKISLDRQPEELKIKYKDLKIETEDEKKARREREEAERKAKEEAERIAREEAEKKAREEEEKRRMEEEARLERERLKREAEEKDIQYLASLTPEEREIVLKERAGLGTSIIDSIESREVGDSFKDGVHPQVERPQIKPNVRKAKQQTAKTFAELEKEEKHREEEERKPRDKVDQEWDDPYDLLPELKKNNNQKNMTNELAALLGGRKPVG